MKRAETLLEDIFQQVFRPAISFGEQTPEWHLRMTRDSWLRQSFTRYDAQLTWLNQQLAKLQKPTGAFVSGEEPEHKWISVHKNLRLSIGQLGQDQLGFGFAASIAPKERTRRRPPSE